MDIDRNRSCSSDPGIRLKASRILNLIDAGSPSAPEVPVKRSPKSRTHVVAQMSLEGSHGFLRLRVCARDKLVLGKELVVIGEEHDSAICIHNPMSPPTRKAKFRFEDPAIPSWVDQLRRIILTGRSNYFETRAYQRFLLPGSKLRRRQSRSAHQVH